MLQMVERQILKQMALNRVQELKKVVPLVMIEKIRQPLEIVRCYQLCSLPLPHEQKNYDKI